VTRIEFMDAWSMAAANAYSGTSYPEGPCLFVEAAGSEDLVTGDLELVEAIASAEGATEIVSERDPDARARLWKTRHDAAHAAAAHHPGTKERATDVCVPLTELAGAAHFARAEIDRLGLNAGILGHAGDGNLHVAIQVTPDGIDASEELVHNIVDDALARGGTCTGEHGVGIGKIGALVQEHGDLIPLMQAIKESFDPNGILNPGKVLPEKPVAAAL
jgi:D-lactate dehydrogenase (cytochrome)